MSLPNIGGLAVVLFVGIRWISGRRTRRGIEPVVVRVAALNCWLIVHRQAGPPAPFGALEGATNGTSLSGCGLVGRLSPHKIAYLDTQCLGDGEHRRNSRV